MGPGLNQRRVVAASGTGTVCKRVVPIRSVANSAFRIGLPSKVLSSQILLVGQKKGMWDYFTVLKHGVPC